MGAHARGRSEGAHVGSRAQVAAGEIRSQTHRETRREIGGETMRMRGLGLAAVALLAMLGPAHAAQPALLPLAPPPPDLVPLLEPVEIPLDKPAVPVPVVPWPAVAGLEGPPPAAVSLPADKPMPALPPSRMLACAGTWLGVASESYECGIARFHE